MLNPLNVNLGNKIIVFEITSYQIYCGRNRKGCCIHSGYFMLMFHVHVVEISDEEVRVSLNILLERRTILWPFSTNKIRSKSRTPTRKRTSRQANSPTPPRSRRQSPPSSRSSRKRKDSTSPISSTSKYSPPHSTSRHTRYSPSPVRSSKHTRGRSPSPKRRSRSTSRTRYYSPDSTSSSSRKHRHKHKY